MVLHSSYAPDFRVKVDGELIPPVARGSVTGLNYQTGLEGADRVELTLANDRLRWLDNPLFARDRSLSLEVGYRPDGLEEVFYGEITGLNATFGSGMPTVTVVAHDLLHRLTSGSKNRAFKVDVPCIGQIPVPDPLIAVLVSVENLLVPYPDPVGGALSFLTLLVAYAIDPIDAKKAIRTQAGESDFDFLSRVARENGWEMTIDHTAAPKGRVLRFRFLVQDYSPAVNLKWGESLLEFTPRITTVGQVVGVSTRIWISSIKLEIVVVLSWDYDRRAFDLMVYPGLGSISQLLGDSAAQSVLTVEAIGPATVPKKLLGELLPRLNNRLTCSGSTVGDPRLKPGEVIQVDGVGGEFGGKYRITSATHSIDSGGYRTSFEARREVWFEPAQLLPTKGLGIQGEQIRF